MYKKDIVRCLVRNALAMRKVAAVPAPFGVDVRQADDGSGPVWVGNQMQQQKAEREARRAQSAKAAWNNRTPAPAWRQPKPFIAGSYAAQQTTETGGAVAKPAAEGDKAAPVVGGGIVDNTGNAGNQRGGVSGLMNSALTKGVTAGRNVATAAKRYWSSLPTEVKQQFNFNIKTPNTENTAGAAAQTEEKPLPMSSEADGGTGTGHVRTQINKLEGPQPDEAREYGNRPGQFMKGYLGEDSEIPIFSQEKELQILQMLNAGQLPPEEDIIAINKAGNGPQAREFKTLLAKALRENRKRQQELAALRAQPYNRAKMSERARMR